MTADVNAMFDEAEASRPGVVHYGTAPAPPQAPARKPLPRQLVASDDRAYWITAAMWRPMDLAAIARCTAIPAVELPVHLGELEHQGRVRRTDDGLWERA